jgi:predicted alpha/beta superfamily hydrolase
MQQGIVRANCLDLHKEKISRAPNHPPDVAERKRCAVMRRWTPLLLCIAALTGCGQPQPESPAKPWREVNLPGSAHTIVGDVRIIPSLKMASLEGERRVWIYLPPGYDESQERYPVLYMHDGQNCFDAATSYAGEWGIDETLEELIQAKAVPPMIVVAVENGGARRMDEYVPFKTKYGAGGEADRYVQFLTQQLKPLIDRSFRTKPGPDSTWIGGSSLGGYISLWAGLHHPEVFGGVLAFSTPFDLGDGAGVIRKALAERSQQPLKVYMDIGQKEEIPAPGIVALNQEVATRLIESGLPEAAVKLVIDPDGEHNEAAWRRRFPDAIRWLTGS